MRKLIETGNQDAIDEDRIQLFVSTGAGNTHGLPELHITMLDPLSGEEIRAWFFKDQLIAALLDPNPTPAALGATGRTTA